MKKNIKRKQVKGFTLVELLAVIVILAIILVIAVPKIMDTIKDATKASLESSAKMVASQVENQYTVAQTLGKEFGNTGSCMEEWAGLNETEYASCRYEITSSGEAKVTIVGKGKFKGLSVCNATRSSAIATEGECSSCPEEEATITKSVTVTKPYVVGNYDSCVSYTEAVFEDDFDDVSELEKLCNGEPIWGDENYDFETYISDLVAYYGFTEKELIENNVIEGSIEEETVCVPDYANDAVTYINNLYNDSNIRNKFGLIKDNTTEQNIRYAGKYVQNYVEFGNIGELWRIIGTFEVKTSDGDTEELVKIVKDEPFKDSNGNLMDMSWDTSESTINGGVGVNEWSQADLKTMLNTYYLGVENSICTYCNDGSCNSCNSSVIPINITYRNMIESVVWNTGAIEWNDDGITPLQAYNAERGTRTGKICTSSGGQYDYCNDTVTRTTEWEGKIGLMYPSDYGYAGGSTCTSITNGVCSKSNWLNARYLERYWTISPNAASDNASCVWRVNWFSAHSDEASDGSGVLTSLYLKSNVKIIDGDGSKNNPYKLS